MTGSLVDVVVSCLEENDHRSRATQAAALLSGPLDPLLADAAALREQLAEAVLAERESCAFLVEQHSGLWDLATIEQCAANIRARGDCSDDAIHVLPDRYAALLAAETRATAAEHALAAEREECARLREALGIALAFTDTAAGEGLAFVEQEDGTPAMDAADLCCDIADRLGAEPDVAYQKLVAAGRAHAAARSALSRTTGAQNGT
jgi:hypothetical protein